jgi:hypothetical protein
VLARDGNGIPGATVTLLNDHGRETANTCTTSDGHGVLTVRVKRGRELPGAVADEEPGSTFVKVHHELAGLLRGPRAVGMPGHAQHVQVAVADLEHEQPVETSQRERAVGKKSTASMSRL